MKHGARRQVVIDGNSRYGKLVALGNKQYAGTRLTKRGKFEERIFEGAERDVRLAWAEWSKETRKEAFIETATPQEPSDHRHVEEKETQVTVAEKETAKAESRAKVYILRVISGRTSRNVAAFHTEDAAFNAAELLNDLSEATNGNMEYDVDELIVRSL